MENAFEGMDASFGNSGSVIEIARSMRDVGPSVSGEIAAEVVLPHLQRMQVSHIRIADTLTLLREALSEFEPQVSAEFFAAFLAHSSKQHHNVALGIMLSEDMREFMSAIGSNNGRGVASAILKGYFAAFGDASPEGVHMLSHGYAFGNAMKISEIVDLASAKRAGRDAAISLGEAKRTSFRLFRFISGPASEKNGLMANLERSVFNKKDDPAAVQKAVRSAADTDAVCSRIRQR